MNVENLILLILGMFVGVLGALLGIGGGVILVPFLVLFLHVPIHQAVAVSLVSIIATSSQVASFELEHRMTDVRLAILLNLFTVSGAISGSMVATHIDARIVQIIFAVILFIIAGLMFANLYHPGSEIAPILRKGGAETAGPVRPDSPGRLSLASGFVFVSGVFSGLAGTSGGIFNVPVLNLVCGMPMRQAAATSSLMIGVTAASGAIVYYRAGLVQPLLVAPTVVGIVIGALVGNRSVQHIKNVWLTRLFIIILIATAIKMILF